MKREKRFKLDSENLRVEEQRKKECLEQDLKKVELKLISEGSFEDKGLDKKKVEKLDQFGQKEEASKNKFGRNQEK